MTIVLQITLFILTILNKTGGREISLKILNFITKNERFFYIDKIYDFKSLKTIQRLIIFLPGKGCEWFLKSGGCAMCGFAEKAHSIGKFLSGKDLVRLTKIAILMTSSERQANIAIYNGGSFLNENEIPIDAQLRILHLLFQRLDVKEVFIESRAEFIIQKKIETIKKELNNKILTIGIGLEAQDDKIRNAYLRKGLSKKNYENAINLLRQNGARSLSYVFLKPIYLDEGKAIEEAIDTIKYAFRANSDEVALESAFIQKGTIMEKLYNENKFRPPWLWSIIKVIEKTRHLGLVRLGGFEDEPPPIAIPQNCLQCSKNVQEAMQKYRETYDLDNLKYLDCQCKKEWLKLLKRN